MFGGFGQDSSKPSISVNTNLQATSTAAQNTFQPSQPGSFGQAGQFGNQPTGVATNGFAATQPTNSLFGQSQAQQKSTFGQSQLQPASNLFGQPQTQQQQSTGLFGQAQQPKPAVGLFGQNPTQFGQSQNTTLPGQTSIFGSKPAFGANATGTNFGQPQVTQTVRIKIINARATTSDGLH